MEMVLKEREIIIDRQEKPRESWAGSMGKIKHSTSFLGFEELESRWSITKLRIGYNKKALVNFVGKLFLQIWTIL